MTENTTESKESTDVTKAEAPMCNSRAETCGETFVPRVDLYETDTEIVLKCDMPGVAADDVDLRFEKGVLSLHGKVKPRQKPADNARREYGVGDFRRTFAIPVKVDATKLSAESSLGVLTVHLPKHEEAKPQKVVVKAI